MQSKTSVSRERVAESPWHRVPSTDSTRGAASTSTIAIVAMTVSLKRSNSAADFSAICPLRQREPDSAKTYENPGRETACRKMDEFPVPVTPALIGRFFGVRRNV